MGDVRFCVPHEARVVLSHDLGPPIYIACEPHSGFHFCFGKLLVMLCLWCLFTVLVLLVSPAVAVGKKRNRDVLDKTEFNDGFPGGDEYGFDIPDEPKTLNIMDKVSVRGT